MLRSRRRVACLVAAFGLAVACGHAADDADPGRRDLQRSDAGDSRRDAGSGEERPRPAGRTPAGPRSAGRASLAADGGRDSGPEPPLQAGLKIELDSGALQGAKLGSTREFLGIPFGQVPKRFAPAEPAAAWSGTLDATQSGPACPQPDNLLTALGKQDESCLSLDVYTPQDVSAPLPVMVFIHGGAFLNGASSQYDARALAETPLVVVAINYRLGPLGFLAHPALDAERPDAPSGNDGIRDQQLALRWVRDNIRAFGGDRDNVTVFGESAGAISACIHLVSPSSRGLAQRYILQSGTCTADGPGVYTKQAAAALGQRLVDALCAGQGDPIACLRAKSAEELAKWGPDMGLWGVPWLPSLDGPMGVLPDWVESLLASGEPPVPFIVGTNQREWGFFQLAGAVKPMTLADYANALSSLFGPNVAMVQAQYQPLADADANDVYVRLVSDMLYRCPTRSLVRLAAARGGKSWLYSFEVDPGWHAQELDYLFGGNSLSGFGVAPASESLSAQLRRYWTRFAIDGDPNQADDPTWPSYEAGSDAHLALTDPPAAGSGLASAACDFWRSYWQAGGTVNLE